MNEKRYSDIYLVFTSILGAKYCDKVPLVLASSGRLERPILTESYKRDYHQKKCQPLHFSV